MALDVITWGNFREEEGVNGLEEKWGRDHEGAFNVQFLDLDHGLIGMFTLKYFIVLNVFFFFSECIFQ